MIKITKRQLRQIIKEATWYQEERPNSSKSPVATKNIGRFKFDANWSKSGLAMHVRINDNPAFTLNSQKEAEELIALLEELLTGPMRTMG